MENKQKWVNLTYVATALLTAYVVFVLATKVSVVMDFEGRVRSLDKILLAGSVGIGLLLFLGLKSSSSVDTFMNEVVVEVGKVSWPTTEETTKGTVAVLIAVIIAGLVLWMFDSVAVWLLGLVL